MRKMYSENQIKDIVNKGIEDGSIHADPSTEVKVSDINSESQTAGKVIISDGEGGAEWGSIQAGMEVVNITNPEGTLSDSDFVIASGNNCIIKYYEMLFTKNSEDDSSIQYISFPYNSYYGYHYLSVITITKSSKRYSSSSVTSINSRATKYEGSYSFPTDVDYSGWSLHRAIKDGNILWLVVCGVIINNSGTSQTLTNLMTVTLPSSISSLIYREDGTKCDSAYSTSSRILTYNGTKGNATFRFQIESSTKNQITIPIGDTFSTGETRVDVRIPLFLDIGV